MRDRLIELLEDNPTLCGIESEAYAVCADYLLAHGVIVPPCKVGQTVYCIRYDKARKPFVKPLGVLSITAHDEGKFSVFTTRDDFWCVTAFPTSEEAEKELERRKSNA